MIAGWLSFRTLDEEIVPQKHTTIMDARKYPVNRCLKTCRLAFPVFWLLVPNMLVELMTSNLETTPKNPTEVQIRKSRSEKEIKLIS